MVIRFFKGTDFPNEKGGGEMKNNKILLVQPNYRDKKDSSIWSINPPLGLAYIAAVLEEHSREVEILDANALNMSTTDVASYAKKCKATHVGLSILTPAHNFSVEVAKKLDNNIISIAGNAHAAGYTQGLLKEGFDYIVRGEGEYSMLEIAKGNDIHQINGIAYLKDGKLVENPCRPYVVPDELPLPSRNLLIAKGVDKPYFSTGTKYYPWSPVFSSRGCPYTCNYCNKLTFGTRFAMRTPGNVLHEIRYLVNELGVKEIHFYDDSFNFVLKRAKEILQLIIKEKLDIHLRFSNGLRVDKVDYEFVQLMVKAGCDYVAYGIESGDQEIINRIHKKISLDDIRRAVRLSKDAGLTVAGFFMFGLIGDSEESMQKTIDFAKELDVDVALFNIATPYPGTKMWEEIEEKGKLLSVSWDDYHHTSGKMMYKLSGTAEPEVVNYYYRKANRDFYFRLKFIKKYLKQLTSWGDIVRILRGAKRVIYSSMHQK